jgi:hypothetical protein
MKHSHVCKPLLNWCSPVSRRVSGKKKPASCKLAVEALEDRLVPATSITSLSQITGPGSYVLTADDPSYESLSGLSNVTVDGAGHAVSSLNINSCDKILVQNCTFNNSASVGGNCNAITWDHNTFNFTSANLASLEITCSNVTVSNNTFIGHDGIDVYHSTDDLLLTWGAVSNLNIENNTFSTTFDCGIEGVGSWDHCSFIGNVVSNAGIGIGGWWDVNMTSQFRPYGFVLTNCTFQNNRVDSTTCYEMFRLDGGNAAWDDAAAAAQWNGYPGDYGNTFSGDTFAPLTTTAPTITQQPTSLTVTAGDSATFSVTASGTAPLTYQWQKLVNGTWTNISGANSPTFTISSTQASDAGQYDVVVSNSAGFIVSNTASLTVNSVVTVPAAPTNLSATSGDSQLSLTWSPSSGATSYNIYRSTSSGGETLLTNGVGSTSFTDTGLSNGTTYYYQVTAVNSAGESARSGQVSAVPQGTTGTIVAQIKFGPPGTATPSGFQLDTGALFNGTLGYGWNTALDSRVRGDETDPLLNSFVYSSAPATWTYNLPNGQYLISLASGDADYLQGPQQVVVNGVTAVNHFTESAGNLFDTVTDLPVSVTNGQLTVTIGGAGGNTMLDYLVIKAAQTTQTGTTVAQIKFGPPGTAAPSGFQLDTGALFNATQGFGWNTVLDSRVRGDETDPLLNSFVYSSAPVTWTYNLPNGQYLITLAIGDADYFQGPQQVVINGVTAVNHFTESAGNLFDTVTDVPVSVTNGQLTVTIGGAGGNTMLDYLVIKQASV